VPQQSVWIVEKLGKYDRKLEPGLNIIIPYNESVPYQHSLKEYAMEVQEQTAITRDNVTLLLDGIIYLKVTDPVHASYGVTNPVFAVTQLAQTTMRSEIGKLTMDATFEERDRLNANIVTAINAAAQTMQVSAERQKRAVILESEAKRQSQINVSEGEKQQVLLKSEAAQIDQINRARGEAKALLMVAEATAGSIRQVAAAISEPGGREAIELKVAEQNVDAFKNLAKTSIPCCCPATRAMRAPWSPRL
jgi:regulator of protease activity HflC (stomatin/prohibitin superfamily)